MSKVKGGILVLDFGSQLTQLIARRLRDLGVYSEILPYHATVAEILELEPKGIILSGGPSSVNEKDAPQRDVKALAELAPVLGICYGMQLIAKSFGGAIEPARNREYGYNEIHWSEAFGKLEFRQKVWMSHGDIVKSPPSRFQSNCGIRSWAPGGDVGGRDLGCAVPPRGDTYRKWH